MDVIDLYDAFRAETMDLATPYLWSDAEVYRNMNAAQNMFCRLQGGIADASTASVVSVDVSADDVFVDISPKILKIRRVTRADYKQVQILNIEDIGRGHYSDDYGVRSGITLDDTTGKILAVIEGMETNKLRLYPIASDDDTLSLVVYRLPILTITGLSTDTLEIDEQHHEYLLLWMMHRAYMKQDAETFDRGKSQEFGAAFRKYCSQARAERERTEHKPRMMVYGGL